MITPLCYSYLQQWRTQTFFRGGFTSGIFFFGGGGEGLHQEFIREGGVQQIQWRREDSHNVDRVAVAP
jgi:hypothetical protein